MLFLKHKVTDVMLVSWAKRDQILNKQCYGLCFFNGDVEVSYEIRNKKIIIMNFFFSLMSCFYHKNCMGKPSFLLSMNYYKR